jgi:uncharacterized coiled-coil protein SlyX
MTADATTARLAELEARYTLQQDLIDKLSEELFRQQRALDALVLRVAAIEGVAKAEEPPDDAPPHY